MKQLCERAAGLKIWDLFWALIVLLLPLTSVPFIVRLVHSDVVAAPSGLLLPIFLAGWCIPLIISERKDLSDNIAPLVLFVLTGFLSTLISFFRTIPEYKGHDPFAPSASAVLTLLVGFSFFLASLLRHGDAKRLVYTFKLVNISGAAVCIWTFAQAFFWFKDQRYPEWMKSIQFMLSIGSLYRQRFVGFTLEPSWLAHQLNLLYLPYWFAASVTGYSAFRFRKGFVTVERILFCIGAVILLLTLSRVGLAAFLIGVSFFALFMVRKLIRKLYGRFSENYRRTLYVLMIIAVLILLAGIAFGLLQLLMKLDFRMAGLFSIDLKNRSDPVFYLAEKLSLAARFVYWDGGISVFNSHPLLGVGLGHAGFYMPELLNEHAYRLIEVRDLLYRTNTLLNIKSLWIRIPAETGIVGFSFFFIWYLFSLLKSMTRLNSADPLKRTAAWMGCFALLAFILEGFSLDTFALPYIWFSSGLAAGAGEIGS